MKGLRVLHVIGGGDTGGAMTHLLPLLSALRRAGCDAQLLCLGRGGLAEEASRRNLPVSVLPMARAWDPSILLPLRRVLSRGPGDQASLRGEAADWDVVHTHGMRANLPVRLAVRARRRRPCVFTTVHSDLGLDYRSSLLARVYRGIDRITLPGVDTVICVSEALRSLLVERGYPSRRLITIRSGIESRDGQPVPRTLRGPDAAPPRVGTVTRLVPVKDLGLMLEVAARLRRTFAAIEVEVVGDGPERDRLYTEAGERGLDGVVRFAGRLDDVRQALAHMDVYLVTSLFEGGMSMSVLEAMAAGIPVVTTAAGGVAEAVQDGVTGFVVARGRDRDGLASSLAERVAALLADSDLRARMGAAGARRIREEFSVEHAAAATLRAYRRCLAAHGRPE